MPITLVDSNVLLDIVTNDPAWLDWSSAELAKAASAGVLAINPIIYAEVAARYERAQDAHRALPPEDYVRLDLPWEAAFVAGRCFVLYRKRGGVRRSPMPDFYIGAHAAWSGLTLLTRDPRRYRRYFPMLKIVAP